MRSGFFKACTSASTALLELHHYFGVSSEGFWVKYDFKIPRGFFLEDFLLKFSLRKNHFKITL
jgi:hypothetical protein